MFHVCLILIMKSTAAEKLFNALNFFFYKTGKAVNLIGKFLVGTPRAKAIKSIIEVKTIHTK